MENISQNKNKIEASKTCVSVVRPCSAVLEMEVMPPSGPVKAAKMSRSQSAMATV